MRNSAWRYGLWAAVLLAVGPASASAQPTIVLDYTYDTNNFFGGAGSAQRLALQAAANKLQSRLTDTFTAISPGNGNTWTASFPNPATGTTQTVTDMSVPQNQIRVFAGGRVLGGTTLGIGGPGGWSGSGDLAFFNSIARGQYDPFAAPSTYTDFGMWGGAITFNTTTSWNFSVSNGPTSGQSDFLSVAEHELAHLLGFGTADSFKNLCSGTTFNGPVSTSLLGGTHPSVTADHGHWASGQSYLGQECAMTPSITVGTRKEFNELDFAGLDDLGWQLTPVPEPTTVFGIAALGLTGMWGLRRRRAAKRLAACAGMIPAGVGDLSAESPQFDRNHRNGAGTTPIRPESPNAAGIIQLEP